jgi:hypothetical protein
VLAHVYPGLTGHFIVEDAHAHGNEYVHEDEYVHDNEDEYVHVHDNGTR